MLIRMILNLILKALTNVSDKIFLFKLIQGYKRTLGQVKKNYFAFVHFDYEIGHE